MQPNVFIISMRPVLLSALAALCLLAPAAQARTTKDLWATVNVCDTGKSPNQMGVRARMPGDGTRRRMYMRFTAQYRKGKKWTAVSGRGRSGWLHAGSALFRNQELGFTFRFDPPKPGSGYVIRGLVQFEWRAKRSGTVVRHSHRYTSGGHPTKPAEPAGYSAATCEISTPKKPAG
jgi:hypothetical protein